MAIYEQLALDLQLEKAKNHVFFHHQKSKGWITLAKRENGIYKQYHYQPSQLAEQLTEWLGEDVYYSQNTFYKPQRRIENIKELRSLYCDLDCYTLNQDPNHVIIQLEQDYFRQSIPEPNIVIFSGQGVVLIWLINSVPSKALPLWNAVQQYILHQLEEFGSDPKAIDAARVFRIEGSINSKNGKVVEVEYRHDFIHELRDIQRGYLPELDEVFKEKTKKKPGRKRKVVQLYNVYRLHHARFLDLVKLVQLRNGNMKGCRETTLFLYRYWLCCYLNDPAEALDATLELNNEFTSPLKRNEVIKATKSAEKAWSARNDETANLEAIRLGYPGAGYNIKNTKIINWLDITPEEMEHLSTIIDSKEKQRRNTEYQRNKRRNNGVKTRTEYIQAEKVKTDNKLDELRKLLGANPEAKKIELAKQLGVGKSRFYELIKQL